MYLKRLVEFAEQQTNLPPIGYSRKEFHWIAIIDNNKLHFIKEEQQNKRIIPDKSRSSDIQPILLADKAEYVFGFTNKDSSDRVKKRLKQQHEAYLSLLEDCAKETNDRDIWNLYNILQKPLPNLPGKLKGSDIIIFRDPVETYLHEKETIQAYWKKKLQPDSNTVTKTRCMLCGTTGAVMERHTIEFPLKSQRTKLISADKPAYQSHGMKASTGSPICFMCEQKYGQALSYLLQNHSGKAKAVGPHMYPIQDITYVYWVRNKKQINFNNLFSISVTTEKEVQELLNSAFSGIKKNNNLKDFSILTVSANKSRMVVRNYEEGSLTNVQHNIECFFNAQDMNNGKRFGIYRLAAMMYQNPTTQMKTYAITTWMEWLLFGRPLPNQVIIPLLKQIQAKGVMYPEHGAAIQSWLISQEVRGEWKLEKIKKEQPYLCGRLFAVLEELQQKATNSRERLSSRYFGSASTAPKSIFGLLIKNSQAHLNTVRKKISDRTANFYSSKIREIAGGLNDFPTVLNLKEQAEFSLGYFHQLQGVTKNKELEGEK